MQEWIYPYPVQTVVISDTQKVAYVDVGAGKYTLLFVHGLGSNLHCWKKNIADLSASYRCIALDLPGYGKSTQADFPFSMRFFAACIIDFIRLLDLGEVVLVGHSMGGQIAIHTVLADRERISRLVLLAPAGLETFSAEERQFFVQHYTPEMLLHLSKTAIIKGFEMNFYQMPDDARFMIEDRFLMMKDKAAFRHFCQMLPRCLMAMLDEPVYADLPQISIPTIVIFGADDQLIPHPIVHPKMTVTEVARKGQLIPQAHHLLLAQSGHLLQWESATAVNQAITHFLY